jgi:hypothetical protein
MNRHDRRSAEARARRKRGYLHRLLAAQPSLPRGQALHGVITHDIQCRIHTISGICTCTPDISIHSAPGEDLIVIDDAGNAKKVTPS